MRELSQSEKFKLAKSVLQKGMNITDLSKIGIDINQFSIQEQMRLHSISSANSIDSSLKKTLDDDIER